MRRVSRKRAAALVAVVGAGLTIGAGGWAAGPASIWSRTGALLGANPQATPPDTTRTKAKRFSLSAFIQTKKKSAAPQPAREQTAPVRTAPVRTASGVQPAAQVTRPDSQNGRNGTTQFRLERVDQPPHSRPLPFAASGARPLTVNRPAPISSPSNNAAAPIVRPPSSYRPQRSDQQQHPSIQTPAPQRLEPNGSVKPIPRAPIVSANSMKMKRRQPTSPQDTQRVNEQSRLRELAHQEQLRQQQAIAKQRQEALQRQQQYVERQMELRRERDLQRRIEQERQAALALQRQRENRNTMRLDTRQPRTTKASQPRLITPAPVASADGQQKLAERPTAPSTQPAQPVQRPAEQVASSPTKPAKQPTTTPLADRRPPKPESIDSPLGASPTAERLTKTATSTPKRTPAPFEILRPRPANLPPKQLADLRSSQLPLDGRQAKSSQPALSPQSKPSLTGRQLAQGLQSLLDAQTAETPIAKTEATVDPVRKVNFTPVAQQVQQAQNANDPLPADYPFEVIEDVGTIQVDVGRTKLMRCKFDIRRTAIVDPAVCDIIQFSPSEISLIGRRAGQTQMTFWFDDNDDPQVYVVKVLPSVDQRRKIEEEYELLEEILRELFPDTKITLTPVADKLIVRGQAKDSEEAAQVMSIVRAQSTQFVRSGQSGTLNQGAAARVLTSQESGGASIPTMQIINMLMVPGVQQIALRVKIAELNRTAARGVGVNLEANIDINGNQGALLLNSMLNAATGNATSIMGSLDNGDIDIGLRWLEQQGVVRVLSEPTLVTLSGRPATFLAGGEFAVPTVVGTGGVNAVTTDFRAFGAIISFNPIVLDKDHIRLQVSPEFSQINTALSVGGTPGLNVRAVSTTVEMREGQTLAIAGLLDESMNSSISGNLPWLEKIIGKRDSSRNETELIILVTPEFMHPMDPEEVPPLPGFDVSEPTDKEFFWHGRIEGHPSRNHRSTVWPRLKRRYGAGGSSMISGPFGHGQ
ncbi:MAG: pilus assembly protein N-terminal domain-containing protein [Pirellulaceae bacterium]|nr:pilus assembly protein N-terminal domain-containing protein [Pirellulaceae bacterium]